MATTFCATEKISESANSPKSVSNGLNSSKTRTFEIVAASEAAAYVLLKAYAPSSDQVDGITLGATPVYAIEPVQAVDGGPNIYRGRVEYRHAGSDFQTFAANELLEVGREKVTFSASGQTTLKKYALSQLQYGVDARIVGNQLNVQYDGTVDGLEVNERAGQFTVSTVIDKDVATNAWWKARFEQVWTINDATFRSWEEGSVALAGIDGRQRADGHWEVDYTFQIKPMEKDLTEVADFPLGVTRDKEGWQYVWAMLRNKEDSGKIVPEVIGIYFADIYEKSNFANLGIQT